ncbi:MAG TPA: hypothetical protein PLD20_08150 [Blastocatellia bacterium]|nr:hypothetical protein [Blastocatellia bacterium]HMX25790.1 hypothetical protein [Blastocatellia bacterium]HMZ17885.1 hypothetical protein [Blastocatellia bacterium]HNG33303.1 hypothetical protein [Blastocatellia bacterium]
MQRTSYSPQTWIPVQSLFFLFILSFFHVSVFGQEVISASCPANVSDHTASVQSDLNTAIQQGKPLYIPVGICKANLVVSTQSFNRGLKIIGAGSKSVLQGVNGNLPVILVYEFSESSNSPISDITIENLTIRGMDLSLTGNSGNHGIHIFGKPNSEASSIRLRNLEIRNCGGKGVFLENHFYTHLQEVEVWQPATGDHAIDLQGNNTALLTHCYVHLTGNGKAAYRIRSGNPVFVQCNGVDYLPGSNPRSGHYWAILGQKAPTDALSPDGEPASTFKVPTPVQATLIGCNIESPETGIWGKQGSTVSVFGTTFQLFPQGTSIPRAILLDYAPPGKAGTWDPTSSIVNPVCDLDPTRKTCTSIGGDGSPGKTNCLSCWKDGYAIHSNGTPFVVLGNTATVNYHWEGQVFSYPQLSTYHTVGSNDVGYTFSRAKIDKIESSTLAGDLVSGVDFTGAASRLLLLNGTPSRPTLAYVNQPTTGLYFTPSEELAISVLGSEKAKFSYFTGNTITGGLTISGGPVQINSNQLKVNGGQLQQTRNSQDAMGSLAFNLDNGNIQQATLTGNVTSVTISNLKDGAFYTFIWKQDATGGRSVSGLTAAFKFSNGVPSPVVTAAANAVDIWHCVSDGTNLFCTRSVDVK